MTRARQHVAAMAPYALADLGGPDSRPAPSLAQNESFRPPCPGALEAVLATMADAALYPDPDWTELRSMIAAHHGIDRDWILCGSGSLELIGCLARAFAGPHRAVLAPEHAYPYFRSAAQASEARFDAAPESDCTASADAESESPTRSSRTVAPVARSAAAIPAATTDLPSPGSVDVTRMLAT